MSIEKNNMKVISKTFQIDHVALELIRTQLLFMEVYFVIDKHPTKNKLCVCHRHLVNKLNMLCPCLLFFGHTINRTFENAFRYFKEGSICDIMNC